MSYWLLERPAMPVVGRAGYRSFLFGAHRVPLGMRERMDKMIKSRICG